MYTGIMLHRVLALMSEFTVFCLPMKFTHKSVQPCWRRRHTTIPVQRLSLSEKTPMGPNKSGGGQVIFHPNFFRTSERGLNKRELRIMFLSRKNTGRGPKVLWHWIIKKEEEEKEQELSLIHI